MPDENESSSDEDDEDDEDDEEVRQTSEGIICAKKTDTKVANSGR